MDDNNKNLIDQESETAEDNKAVAKDKIEWIGIDGALLLLFVALVIVMYCSLKYRIDALTGYVFPLVLLIIVLVVAVKYAMTIGGFIKMQNQTAKDKKAAREAQKDSE